MGVSYSCLKYGAFLRLDLVIWEFVYIIVSAHGHENLPLTRFRLGVV